jgi:hypothetical protein
LCEAIPENEHGKTLAKDILTSYFPRPNAPT